MIKNGNPENFHRYSKLIKCNFDTFSLLSKMFSKS